MNFPLLFPLLLLQPFPARMATIAHIIIIIITIIIAAVVRIIITVIKFHTMATTQRSIWIAWNPMAIYPLIKQIADMAVSGEYYVFFKEYNIVQLKRFKLNSFIRICVDLLPHFHNNLSFRTGN